MPPGGMLAIRARTASLSVSGAAGTATWTSSSNTTRPKWSVGSSRPTRSISAVFADSSAPPAIEPLRSSTTWSVLGGRGLVVSAAGAASSSRTETWSCASMATTSRSRVALRCMTPLVVADDLVSDTSGTGGSRRPLAHVALHQHWLLQRRRGRRQPRHRQDPRSRTCGPRRAARRLSPRPRDRRDRTHGLPVPRVRAARRMGARCSRARGRHRLPEFKNAVAERQGYARAKRYGKVWEIMLGLQRGDADRAFRRAKVEHLVECARVDRAISLQRNVRRCKLVGAVCSKTGSPLEGQSACAGLG